MQAIVLAVPITMQVPDGRRERPLDCVDFRRRRSCRRGTAPTGGGNRCRRPAPRRCDGRRASGPVGSTTAGMSALAAAISCAGSVLSQPPIEHHRVHRLGADHLLGVHRHQVAQEHASGVGEALVDGDGGEDHRQAAGQHHAALDRLDQVGDVAVAGVEVAVGVGDADDRPVERVVGVAHGLDEGLAEEQREAGVAVVG